MTPQSPENLFSKGGVAQTVSESVAHLNAMLPSDRRISDSLDTILIGEGGSLDSLSLVNLAVDLEQRLSKQWGISVDILESLSDEANNIITIGQLTKFLELEKSE